jgi:hypothetical protein
MTLDARPLLAISTWYMYAEAGSASVAVAGLTVAQALHNMIRESENNILNFMTSST